MLTHIQFEQLTNALLGAFPDPANLVMMVKFKLDENLVNIAPQNQIYKLQVFKLVEWANAQDRIEDLVVGALNMNERNKALRAISEQLFLDEGAGAFESMVLGSVPITDVETWRMQMMTNERAVCRVEIPREGGDKLDEIGVGTGFLVGGRVVITNWHVVAAIQNAGYKPEQIVLRFDYKMKAGTNQKEVQEGVTYTLNGANPILDQSDVAALDYALLNVDGQPAEGTVAGQPGAPVRGWLKPVSYQFKKDDPIFIIQHPKATPLKFAPGAVDDPSPSPNRVGYTTNTDNGSSGSPCCTADWRVVALHHWGGANHNRGVRFSAILDSLTPKKVPGFMVD
jgi:hypothetical protein